ncbi:MAG: alpha/beta hydrolase [Acidobacteria bacterium]|nr:alpha/beta hydrolase [Acidobacteriota bacterium]
MTRRALLAAPALCAQDILERKPPAADLRIPYGKNEFQFGDLRIPSGKGPFPVVVNFHGGYWRAAYNLEHNGHLCEALRAKGIAAWSLEYRRVGNPGGGWPGTFEDARAGAEFLKQVAAKHPLDLKRTIVMGHSAGGHLALYVAHELAWLKGAISLAGVVDLRRGVELKLGREQVKVFMGGTPEEVPDRYKLGSPIERIPMRCPTVLIHGTKDTVVPPEISERYAAAARKAGDKVKLDLTPNGHFELIDPLTPDWKVVERRVSELLAG